MTMLLYKTAVAPLREAGQKGWFIVDGLGGVTDYDDAGFAVSELTSPPNFVKDVSWTLVADAKVVGLHDDEEVSAEDPRFNQEAEQLHEFGVVRSPTGRLYMLMSINVPEALLMPAAELSYDGNTFEFGNRQQ
ncbi:hypothetical protein [Burkholderia sp. PR2]|uniref:hypothetical protein n=1 Tax=Burkholderia sp. PR2 TaxID=3448078 RepID=UPI00402A6E7E